MIGIHIFVGVKPPRSIGNIYFFGLIIHYMAKYIIDLLLMDQLYLVQCLKYYYLILTS